MSDQRKLHELYPDGYDELGVPWPKFGPTIQLEPSDPCPFCGSMAAHDYAYPHPRTTQMPQAAPSASGRLTLKLRANTGYEADYHYPDISSEQWGDVIRVCEGRLSSAANPASAPVQQAAPSVDTDVLHVLLSQLRGAHSAAINVAYCPNSEPFKAAQKQFNAAYHALSGTIDAINRTAPAQPAIQVQPAAPSEARYSILQEVHSKISLRRDGASPDFHEGMNKAINTVERMMLATAPAQPAGLSEQDRDDAERYRFACSIDGERAGLGWDASKEEMDRRIDAAILAAKATP